MKEWTVWTIYGNFVKIRAEKIVRHDVDDKPVKIRFMTGDDVTAEFYAERICGWVQEDEAPVDYGENARFRTN